MWIATGTGLDLYNRKSRKKFFCIFKKIRFKHTSISDNQVQSKGVIEDMFGNIWVGTWNGLNRIKFNNSASNKNIVQNITVIFNDEKDSTSLSNNRVISLEKKTLRGIFGLEHTAVV